MARQLAGIQLRASLAEKETLLREIHHRVKNNLQVVSGLLHVQAKTFLDPDDILAFAELRQRIFAMTLVHERLYQSADVASIDFRDYLRTLVAELVRSFTSDGHIRIEVHADDLRLPIESALPGGMIATELITNVLKYAFPGHSGGTASLSLAGDRVHLSVDDTGVGVPDGFDPGAGTSFGWELIRTLTLQLDGTVETTTDRGAHVRVSFPATTRAEGRPA